MRKVVILLIALTLGAAAFAWVGCGGGGTGADTPEGVVEAFLSASVEGDADAAFKLITTADQDRFTNKEDLVEGFTTGVEGYEVGPATISGDTARVPVSFQLAGLEQDFEFDMIVVDEAGAWRISISASDVEVEAAMNKLMEEVNPPE
jgi:hypothetical protein